MNYIETEDNALDAVQKAYRGLSRDGARLTPSLPEKINQLDAQLQSKNLVEKDWMEVAKQLNLHGTSLFAFAKQPSVEETTLPSNWQQWVLPFGPYTVNSYALPLANNHCLIIDAGNEPKDFFDRLKTTGKQPSHLLITHNHRDHVGALKQLLDEYPELKVYAMDPSICRNTTPLADLSEFEIEDYLIQAHHTPGHAADSISYMIRGKNSNSLALAVGDCIYAKSTGGIPANYKKALEVIREKILNSPDNTLLLPGHGPVTTVSAEKQHNPFFAGSPLH